MLSTDVWLPSLTGGPWPVVLVRTPCDAGDVQAAIDRGLVGVSQDMRGFFGSGGSFEVFRADGWGPVHRDGRETVEWLLAQPWCDGNIATQRASESRTTPAGRLARTLRDLPTWSGDRGLRPTSTRERRRPPPSPPG